MNRISMLVVALLLAACTREDDGSKITAPKERDYAAADLPEKAAPDGAPYDAAVQLSAAQGSTVTGTLALTGAPQGVHITGAVEGLSPDGEFGFHIHEKGDCSAPDASSAGGHFNPAGQQHGNPEGESHHAGDMINIRSNAEGVAEVDTTAMGTTIHSGERTDVLGKAIVVHERADDYKTQPSGDSGKRVACGVIAAAQ